LNSKDRKNARIRRHIRVRKKIFGVPERPRLSVFRSIKNIYAQIIDDQNGVTLVTMSTLSPEIREKVSGVNNIQAAKVVGEAIGKKALDNNITKVVFDRSGYIYHGKVKALADAAREAGLQF
jgi:large subunit ribosomal protein L18